jgi:4'-phosphopantetheinyl transferase
MLDRLGNNVQACRSGTMISRGSQKLKSISTLDHLWDPPPADLKLSRATVHVWRASLNQMASHVYSLEHTLTPDELSRARRFRCLRDRRRFILARGLLRTVLSRYLGIEPGQLRFCRGDCGKPYLASKHGPNALSFTVSHSDGLALYAIARGRQIGVDLERIRPIPGVEDIAARFFSTQENAALLTLPAPQRQKAFFTCWTRKEAYIKARGEGLSLPLDGFRVSLTPGEPAMLLSIKDDPQEAARWSLRELRPGLGYVAALAVEGHERRVICWQFTEREILAVIQTEGSTDESHIERPKAGSRSIP